MNNMAARDQSIPLIQNIEVNSFGTKIVTLKHDDGTLEYLTAEEGEHYYLERELKSRGII